MPIYEFECTKCHSKIEISCPISASDDLDPLCFAEGCDGEKTTRLMSCSSFVLKGTGWAKDGYR